MASCIATLASRAWSSYRDRQPAMYFRLGGGTLKGISKPGFIVWSRVFIMDGKLHCDLGVARVVELPRSATRDVFSTRRRHVKRHQQTRIHRLEPRVHHGWQVALRPWRRARGRVTEIGNPRCIFDSAAAR